MSAAPLGLALPFLARKRPRFGATRFMLALLAGIAAVVPAAMVQALVPRLEQGAAKLLIHAFFVIAATEEGAKYLLLRLFRKRWGDPENAVPAGVAASLGFAFFETALYASTNPAALLVRAITAAPLHAACGSWVGRAALAGPDGRPASFLFLLFSIFVHGAYDLTLSVPGFPTVVPVLIALLGLAVALRALQDPADGDI